MELIEKWESAQKNKTMCVAESQHLKRGDYRRVHFSDNCILDIPEINDCPAEEKAVVHSHCQLHKGFSSFQRSKTKYLLILFLFLFCLSFYGAFFSELILLHLHILRCYFFMKCSNVARLSHWSHSSFEVDHVSKWDLCVKSKDYLAWRYFKCNFLMTLKHTQ